MLYDAEGINPEVADIEDSRYVDCVLERSGDTTIGYASAHVRKVLLGSFERDPIGPPAMTKG